MQIVEVSTSGTKPRWRHFVTSIVVTSYFAYSFLLYSKLGFLNRNQTLFSATGDNTQQVWFLAWPAHALRHGLSPLWSSAMDVPYGINMLSNTSMPLLGVVFAPVTWVFGAIATYNTLMQLALGISATSAYYVARKLNFTQLASWLTGLLYGFSSYFVAQGQAHLFLTFAPIPPLVLWLVWRIVIQRGPVRRLGITVAVLEGLELLISAERVVMTVVVTALLLIIGAIFSTPEQRATALQGLKLAAGPTLLTALALGILPVLLGFFGPWAVRGNPHTWTALHHGDVLEFVQPNAWYRPIASWARVQTDPLLGANLERSYYLGLPLLAMALLGAWKFRSYSVARMAVISFLCVSLLSLGNRFWIGGHNTHIPTPFAWVTKVPVLSSVIPNRYMLFVSLLFAFALGALVDQWRHHIVGSGAKTWAKKGLAAVFVLSSLYCFVPAARFSTAPSSISTWFESDEFRSLVTPGSNVLLYPYPNPFFNHGMLIQADTDMRFNIVGGQAIVGDAKGHNQGITMEQPWQISTVFMRTLWGATDGPNVKGLPGLDHQMPPRGPHTVTAFREFAKRYKITTVIATPFGVDNTLAVSYISDAFGAPQVRNAGEIRFWRIPPAP